MFGKANTKYLFTFLSIVALLTYGFFVQAAYPSTQYNPGETSDPASGCTPGSSNCSVAVPFLTDQVSGYVYSNNTLHDNAFIFGDSNTTWTTGEETKMFFDAANQAIRMGSVDDTEWDVANNGAKSIALGYAVPGFFAAPKASGSLSFAYGSGAIAGGVNSIAFGTAANATGTGSSAFGNSASALAAGALAFQGGEASGTDSIAFGDGGEASAAQAITFFGTASASNAVSFFGNASAANTLALGTTTNASAAGGTALGLSATASGINSLAFNAGTASGLRAFAFRGTASGDDSIALGDNAEASGDNMVAIGPYAGKNITTGDYGIFIGATAGQNATNAGTAVFIGSSAGTEAAQAINSIFFGVNTGRNATSAANSIFAGTNTGQGAANASSAVFIGGGAGETAVNAEVSTFLGYHAGYHATNAEYGIFLGPNAGSGATNAAHSIFIGDSTGLNASVDNTVSGTSIAIGNSATPGAHKNSIALGTGATNSAANQFMIGSAGSPINTMILTGSGNSCTLDVTVGSPSCTSDERLKTNISDLSTGVLDKVTQVRTVNYNWINYPNAGVQTGFLAQNLQQFFPEVVDTAPNGYLTVSYGGMTPILTQAIRELKLQFDDINAQASKLVSNQGFLNGLIAFFNNASNGIVKLFAGEIETKNLCVADESGSKTCITKSQLDQILLNQTNGTGGGGSPAPDPIPDPVPTPTPTPDPVPDPEETPPDPIPDPAPTPDPIPDTPPIE